MTEARPADFTAFNAVDDHGADYFVRFLDARTAIPGEIQVKQLITEHLHLQAGLAVLDIGCGTGSDTCLLADAVGVTGRVVGLDSSTRMIEESRRRAAAAHVPVTFVEGTATALPFPDDSFDRCRTERVLAVLDDPAAAVREMARVTRPGGVVVVSEIDTGTAFLDASDPSVVAALTGGMSDGLPHGHVGRHLHRMLVEAGLTDVRCHPRVVLNSVAFMRLVLGDLARRLVAAGEISADAADTFWAEQERGEEQGWLCTGVVCFTVSGRVA
jgi:ubiquinone/menaquinone biosynthesis C-methylase UbiE